MKETPDSRPKSGAGVDAWGGPVFDPSANVIALVKADKERGDDLRSLQSLYIQAQIATLNEIVKRVEQVSKLQADHAKDIGVIHQIHDREIHKMEQEKLAAFRASDEAARINEANRNLAALQVVERTLSSTATTLAAKTAADYLESNKRIAALEKSSYEGAGKGTGAKNLWGYIVAAVLLSIAAGGFVITIAGIIVAVAYAIRS